MFNFSFAILYVCIFVFSGHLNENGDLYPSHRTSKGKEYIKITTVAEFLIP